MTAAAALAAIAGCGGDPAAASSGAVYAALGDSDSSGAGIAPVEDETCARSGANYASQVATALGYRSFKDVSCGGATTKDLSHPQKVGTTTRPPQLDAVGSRTRLVTLTIGLNDQQVSSALLYACLSPTHEVTAWCQQVLDVPEATLDQGISDAADRVEQALRLIRKKAPHARVVLVGYPRFLPESGSCPDRVPFVDAMVPRVREILGKAAEQWKDAAERAGAEYVDSYALSEGHDACAADPWLNGPTTVPGKAAPMHPFEGFHRAVADAIVGLLKRR